MRAGSTPPTWHSASHRASVAPTSCSGDGLSHFLLTVEVGAADAELLAFELWNRGAVGVEEQPGALRGAFDNATEARRARDALAPTVEIEEVDDTCGFDAGRDLLDVEVAGRFSIHPPWLDPTPDRVAVEIDPGHAFGSGSHPSTRLALELIGDEDPPPSHVFDIGCGTGVLSIGAALLGARVTAVDIDPAAIAATEANAERNGVADRITAMKGSAALRTGAVDLVVVNVTIDVHERLAPQLHPSHHRLIVAGVLGRPQLDRCALAYAASIERSIDDDGWMAAVLTRS